MATYGSQIRRQIRRHEVTAEHADDSDSIKLSLITSTDDGAVQEASYR